MPGQATRGASDCDELERGQIGAERVGRAVRVEADSRRDLRQQVVARDQDAVAQQAHVAVRMAGRLEDAPAGDLVAQVSGSAA